jgi:hypothetical protein
MLAKGLIASTVFTNREANPGAVFTAAVMRKSTKTTFLIIVAVGKPVINNQISLSANAA